MTKTLSVSAIKNGSVIDHIRAGQALRIMRLLHILDSNKNKVTLGLNLPSKLMGLKDLIKVENRALTDNAVNEVVIFAPEATINIIENFEVIQKITPQLPDSIVRIFNCLNPACVTQYEWIESQFLVQKQGNKVKLTCHYCEKEFDRDNLKVNIQL